MMEVNIKANTIQQVVNADVINMDQIKQLSVDDKNDIIDKLIKSIEQQTEVLMKKPNEIPSADVLKLAEQTNDAIKDVSKDSENVESKKNKVNKILKNIKDCLGNTSDILFNAVKISQMLNIQ